jgi:hypothetical protein
MRHSFLPSSRSVARYGRVEHLHEMRPFAQGGERFEESFEHAAAAQAPEALPDAVPGAELGRPRPPRNVVDREIVQGFEKLAVVPPLVPTPRAAAPRCRKKLNPEEIPLISTLASNQKKALEAPNPKRNKKNSYEDSDLGA